VADDLAVAPRNADDAGVIKLLDPADGKERLSLVGHRYQIRSLVFSPEGRRLDSFASSLRAKAEVKVWELASGWEMLTFPAKEVGSLINNSLVFSSDGQRLIYIPGGKHPDAELQVWDATPMPDQQPGMTEGR